VRGWVTSAIGLGAMVVALFALPASSHAQQQRLAPPQQLGIMVWGSGYFQIVYRTALTNELRFEMGGLAGGAGHAGGVNASLGLSYDFLSQGWWSPYVVGGPGLAGAQTIGGTRDTTSGIAFIHARTGLAAYLDKARTVRAALEGGGWLGVLDSHRRREARTFLWPVGGLGFYVSFE
jgi:hypothetical protein